MSQGMSHPLHSVFTNRGTLPPPRPKEVKWPSGVPLPSWITDPMTDGAPDARFILPAQAREETVKKTMFATTLIMPRQWEILVETRQGKAGSQLSHNSIRQSKQEQTEQCLILELDEGSILDCRLGIGRGDGSIILTIDSKPNPNSCSFFVLRPTEWQQTVSLWLQTSFVIWRQMWGETRGRWEGWPVGKFSKKVLKFGFFCGFPATYRFRIFWIFPRFPAIVRGPKKYSKHGFFRSVSGFWRTGLSKKIFAVFPQWTGPKIWIFPRCPAIFRGPKKFSKHGFSPGFLGILKDGLVQNFPELGLPHSFVWWYCCGIM